MKPFHQIYFLKDFSSISEAASSEERSEPFNPQLEPCQTISKSIAYDTRQITPTAAATALFSQKK